VTDLAEITRMRKWAYGQFRGLGSPVFDAFLEMEKAAFADGALGRKSKELIAVGISVAQGCASCIQWHVEHAAEAGASRREVLEAVGGGHGDGRGTGDRVRKAGPGGDGSGVP